MALAYLIDPQNQFMTKSGTINVAGTLRVYDAATDDAAVTYCDFNGTENEEAIVLDNNGRAIVIADSDKAYRLEVYDRYGTLMWTTTPIWCLASGGGVMLNITDLISSDGSISIYKTKVGSTTTFDIGIAPDNAKELLEWSKCYNTVDTDGYVYPLYSSGTMNILTNEGLEVFKDRYYHLTNKITVVPSGSGINYETITVQVMHDDGQGTVVSLCSHDFDIDNSVSDKVELEFSEDIIPEDDGYLFWNVTGRAPFNSVGLDMQVHRIYSGINAVPGSIASKAWVEQNISSKIDYSALEYNQQNLITGISGSAIASNEVDPNEFIPWSASGTFQPSGDYVYESAFSSYSSVIDNSITAISSVVSGVSGTYLEKTASGMFQPSGEYVSSTDMSAYIPFSGLDMSAGKITGISGTSLSAGKVYTGINPVYVDNTADQIGVYRKTLAVDETMTAYESGDSAVIGVNTAILSGYAKASSLEDYQLKSAMTAYASVEYVDSGMSGKLDVTASSLFLTSLPADLATTGDVASAVSGKMDKSASGEFYPMTGNPSGFLTAHQSLAGYATEQYVDSSVSGKLDTTAYNSAQFILTSQSGMFQASGEYLSATESSKYYSTSNPSGFITGVDLTPYQLTADMSSYQPSGNYLSATESSNYYPSSNPSGFITGVDLTPYQLTANMTGYIPVSALGTGEL